MRTSATTTTRPPRRRRLAILAALAITTSALTIGPATDATADTEWSCSPDAEGELCIKATGWPWWNGIDIKYVRNCDAGPTYARLMFLDVDDDLKTIGEGKDKGWFPVEPSCPGQPHEYTFWWQYENWWGGWNNVTGAVWISAVPDDSAGNIYALTAGPLQP